MGAPAIVRVGFAVGSWQLISLAAALDAAGRGDDHVVLYETDVAGPELETAMHAIAATVRPWLGIVDAFDLFKAVPRKPGQWRLDQCIRELRARIGLERIDELWLCWVSRPSEKLVLEAYPEARVMLYEDGLTSYMPQARPMRREPAPAPWLRMAPAPLRRWLDPHAPARRFRRHRSGIDPVHLRRIDGAWMLLADSWPAPSPMQDVPRHPIDQARLAATLRACQTIPSVAGFDAAPRTRPTVLVLGQTLSRWGAISRDDELAIYAGVVALAVERGYDVWWKEHPRSREPFFDDLSAQAPANRLRRLELPYALPIELVAGRLGLVACIAGISAALFTLSRFCGVDGYTFADALEPHVSGQWAVQNRMVRGHVPAVQELPEATALRPTGI